MKQYCVTDSLISTTFSTFPQGYKKSRDLKKWTQLITFQLNGQNSTFFSTEKEKRIQVFLSLFLAIDKTLGLISFIMWFGTSFSYYFISKSSLAFADVNWRFGRIYISTSLSSIIWPCDLINNLGFIGRKKKKDVKCFLVIDEIQNYRRLFEIWMSKYQKILAVLLCMSTTNNNVSNYISITPHFSGIFDDSYFYLNITNWAHDLYIFFSWIK